MFCFGNLWHDRGGIAPVLKTDDMTQAVGVAQDGTLWTAESGGGGGTTEETGTFHINIGSVTINGGKWVKTGSIVYFYIPNTGAAISTPATSISLVPDDGQPAIPLCAAKFLEWHRIVGSLEYAVFGDFTVTSGGAYAEINNLHSYMQNFSTPTNRTADTSGTPYYMQYMTLQFSAIVLE